MKKDFASILACLLLVSVCASCSHHGYGDDDPDIDRSDGRVAMFFHIDMLASEQTQGVAEKVRSLRIIVFNDESIEYNTRIDITEKNQDAGSFMYDFRWLTEPGDKHIMVFANEESVKSIEYVIPSQDPDDPPEIIPEDYPRNLTELLDMYEPDSEKTQELITIMNYVAFEPDFSTEESAIYLPYSTYYDIKAEKATSKWRPIYLVPVATKFIFKFENKRQNAVKVNGISLASVNRSTYLMGQPDELTKMYGEKSYYWVDWLQRILEASGEIDGFDEFDKNVSFNSQVGWIIDYKIPNPDDAAIYNFPGKDDSSVILTIEGAKKVSDPEDDSDADPDDENDSDNGSDSDDIIPSYASTPVYYLPESRNYKNPELISENEEENDDEGQTYYLTLLLEDIGTGTGPLFENVPIPNLKALFRNTYVIIKIEMSEGDIEVYGEIAKWNEKEIYGWVEEGEEPANNPFRTE